MFQANPQVIVDELPSVDDIIFTKVDPRYKKVSFISVSIILGIIGLIFIGIGWLVESSLFEIANVVFAISALCFIGIFWFYFIIRIFENTGYAIREKDIIYKEGIIYKSTVVVPFNRVQHCEVSQGPISRLMGLASLTLYTAGGSASDVNIDGLDKDVASKLKDFVSGKIRIDERD